MNGLEILVGGLTATIFVLVVGLAKLVRQNAQLKKERR
jgi:hypothetical protein